MTSDNPPNPILGGQTTTSAPPVPDSPTAESHAPPAPDAPAAYPGVPATSKGPIAPPRGDRYFHGSPGRTDILVCVRCGGSVGKLVMDPIDPTRAVHSPLCISGYGTRILG
jgi:hypothetical protein